MIHDPGSSNKLISCLEYKLILKVWLHTCVHLFLLYQFCSHYQTAVMLLAHGSWYISCHGESPVQTNFYGLFSTVCFSACNGGSRHMAKCWPHLWCAKRTFIVWGLAKIFITDYLILSQEQSAHSKEDKPNGSFVIVKFEAQWAHLWCAPLFWFGIRLIQIWSVSLEGYKLCGRVQVLVGLL